MAPPQSVATRRAASPSGRSSCSLICRRAHLALGYCFYYGDSNYDAAEKEFAIAQRGLPNNAEVLLSIGAIQRRKGNWTESTANLEKALSLNPNSTWPLQNLVFNYEMNRDYANANKTVDRALQIEPKNIGLWEIKAKLAAEEQGDLSVAEKGLANLESSPLDADKRRVIAVLRGERSLISAQVRGSIARQNLRARELRASLEISFHRYRKKGLADDAGAREAFLKAKEIAQKQIAEGPDDARRRATLAGILAWLGEKDTALAEAQRAVELLPESKDAFEGPVITESLAEVHAILGNSNEAIEILDGLLTRPSEVTVETLKLNPVWDSLRGNPGFAEILARHGAKA